MVWMSVALEPAAKLNVNGVRLLVKVMFALAEPTVAVMVAEPMRVAVTTPVVETAMMVGAELVHVIVLVSTLPAASLATAVSAVVAPASLAVAPEIVTLATAGMTVTVLVADFAPAVAVIVASPTATPVTRPVALTVA